MHTFIHIGPVPSKNKNMQTLPLKSNHIYMKYEQCAEKNNKSILPFFRFIFLELWLIVFTIFGDPKKIRSKVAKFT